MATKSTKSTSKVTTKAESKPATKKASVSKSKPSASISIEKAAEDALKKLTSLKLDEGLQSDLEWCLGSYRHDNNPSGLYTMVERAIPVLEGAAEKNKKSVSAKLLADLSKAIKH